ncbi:MAG: helix-hairpin-helix domain-containing protein [Anaerolineaceae bacterium]|jgi:hypothetical protein|nr:helix-hairpin-helix domain-containing protein [Anaerolineaceae bacterium]
MTEGPVGRVDVNSASFEALTAVSGIGEGLAEKIIAGRPYASLDDLTRVRGISDRSVERWAPFLTIDPADGGLPIVEAEIVEEDIEPDDLPVDEDEVVEVIAFNEEADDLIPPLPEMAEKDLIPEEIPEAAGDADTAEAEQEVKPPEKKQAKKEKDSKVLLRSDAFLLGGVVGVLSVLLAVVLALGILAVVNGGLDYVSPGQLSNVQRQVQTIEGQIGVLTQDIDGLSTRLDALDALGGRVADLESMAEQMGKEVAQMKAELAGMEEQMDALTRQYGVVESFLGGMQNLLNDLLPETALPAGE